MGTFVPGATWNLGAICASNMYTTMKAMLSIAGLLALSVPVLTSMTPVPPAAPVAVPAPARLAASAPSLEPTDTYTRAIALLGGRIADPGRFANNVEGFEGYLAACGVTSIGAAELTTPHHADVAARLGYTAFLPPREWWSRGAALALLSERLGEAAGQKVVVRNWWRPAAYNSDPAVRGARNGDHPTANAIDLDYPTAAGRMRAEQFLRKLERNAPWLNLSLGLGAQTTHVGIASPRGHREWHYAGYVPAPLAG